MVFIRARPFPSLLPTTTHRHSTPTTNWHSPALLADAASELDAAYAAALRCFGTQQQLQLEDVVLNDALLYAAYIAGNLMQRRSVLLLLGVPALACDQSSANKIGELPGTALT